MKYLIPIRAESASSPLDLSDLVEMLVVKNSTYLFHGGGCGVPVVNLVDEPTCRRR